MPDDSYGLMEAFIESTGDVKEKGYEFFNGYKGTSNRTTTKMISCADVSYELPKDFAKLANGSFCPEDPSVIRFTRVDKNRAEQYASPRLQVYMVCQKYENCTEDMYTIQNNTMTTRFYLARSTPDLTHFTNNDTTTA